MKPLRSILDRLEPHFSAGGAFHALHPLFESIDTLLYSPSHVTQGPTHARDGLDLKRLMFFVVLSLLPCVGMAMYNTGYQAHLAISAGAEPLAGWRTEVFSALGFGFDPANVAACFVHGALYFVPIFVVCFATGLGIEIAFAGLRRHEVNEGFFVTGFLIPLILPATVPLWQVAFGTAFAVVVSKEIFGGTGMNVLNVALVARAFLFFAYPAQLSGRVWIAAEGVDAVSSATMLAAFSEGRPFAEASWMDAFLGFIPGSLGETSTLFALLAAAFLVITQIASWRIMLGVTLGTALTAFLLNAVGSNTNPMMSLPAHWHFVVGGWAFGTAFMATDPVTASVTRTGQLVYGAGIGILTVLIRVVNPAYPEGMMLAILFMNLFAPLIDHVVFRQNVRRRQARYAARGGGDVAV